MPNPEFPYFEGNPPSSTKSARADDSGAAGEAAYRIWLHGSPIEFLARLTQETQGSPFILAADDPTGN